MFEINNVVKKLDIDESFKSILSDCISAEIFSLKKLYNPEITVLKYTQPNDSRV